MAGMETGTGGSPMPDGASVLGITWTSTAGIPGERSTGNRSKFSWTVRPRSKVISLNRAYTPKAMPPSTWPAMPRGLRGRPQSTAAVTRCTRRLPFSTETSATSAT